MNVRVRGTGHQISTPLQRLGVLEEVILPGGRFVLDRADAVHELGQGVGVLRCDREFELRVVDDFQQCGPVDLRAGHADVGIGSGAFVFLGEVGRLGQGLDERVVGLGVFLAEFLGGEQHGG